MADEQAAQFETLLQNLMSPDPEVRNPSETTYDNIPAQNRVTLLVQCMCNQASGIEVRTMSAVLLRRLFTSSFEEVWPLLGVDLQAGLKQQLLMSIQMETQPAVRRKVCDAVAEFARCMLDDDGNNTWLEILKFLFESARSQDASLRESALHIFGVVPGIFGSQQAHYLDVIKQMLSQSVTDTQNKEVRIAAVKAITSFVLSNEKEVQLLNHFRDLLPGMIHVISESIMAQEDDTLLKCLVDLAESTPKFLRSHLPNILNLALKVTADANQSDQWRHLGLEVVVTLSETAPAMLRKQVDFIPLLVPQVLALMVDLEEEPDWSTSDEVEEEDNDTNAIAGESALDRLACGLGGKTMLPHITSNIPQMLQSADWRYRHAALMAISACGEGCHKQMEGMLENIVATILQFIQDPHPRVRYATCNALGQMCSDFGPNFQKKFHEKIVQSLLLVLDDNDNPRVQAHAGAALVNFSEGCPKGILSLYLDAIITKLEQVLNNKISELMQKGTKLVLEQVVTTLASVADTAEEKFINYYDRFMPCLKNIVQNAVNPELKMLRGKTIECVSLIGLAVGRDKFMADCSEVMQLLLKTQTDMEQMEDDDPQISYMISAWARMCKIMGKDFEQYLPLVMGPVLKAAAIKPEVAVVDNEDMKSLESDADWQFVTLGDQQSFGIRTAGLEEKATACQMLVCYARELKEGFAAYTEEVVKIMVPLLKFYFHDEVRVAAAESLPFLLDCARIRGADYLAQMWQFISTELLKAVETEPESDIKSAHMHALAQCIERMGSGCLNNQQFGELGKIIEKTMNEHFEKQLARQDQRQDEDYDEEVEETLLDEDDEDVYILSKISDVMHALFGTHKEAVLPFFEQLLPHFVKLLASDRPWPDKQWGLCIWDDVLEHTGPHALKYAEYFLQPLVEYIGDRQGEVRQAAAYGIGVMAQFGGEGFAQALVESVPRLQKVIEDPESRSVENVNPTENAISAVTKICKYCPAAVKLEVIIPQWLSWLPVYEDEDEAVHIYGYLCDLVELNHPLILGENNVNLPNILCIFAEAFHRECLSKNDEVTQRMMKIVLQVQSNAAMAELCAAQMTEPQKLALSKMLSGNS